MISFPWLLAITGCILSCVGVVAIRRDWPATKLVGSLAVVGAIVVLAKQLLL